MPFRMRLSHQEYMRRKKENGCAMRGRLPCSTPTGGLRVEPMWRETIEEAKTPLEVLTTAIKYYCGGYSRGLWREIVSLEDALEDWSDARRKRREEKMKRRVNSKLLKAIRAGDLQEVKSFFDHCFANWSDGNGRERYLAADIPEALRYAAILGDTEIVKFFVKQMRDVYLRGPHAKETRDLAAEKGHTEVVRILDEAAGKGVEVCG